MLRSASRTLEEQQMAAAEKSEEWLANLMAQGKRQAAVSEQTLKAWASRSPFTIHG